MMLNTFNEQFCPFTLKKNSNSFFFLRLLRELVIFKEGVFCTKINALACTVGNSLGDLFGKEVRNRCN